jgi:hypothetical protein
MSLLIASTAARLLPLVTYLADLLLRVLRIKAVAECSKE